MKRTFVSSRWAYALSALLISAAFALADFVTTANPVHPSGVRAMVDAPPDLHIKNIGGSDGAGLCVGTSNEVAGRYQSMPELDGFQSWLHKRPGGSYPEMLEADLKKFASSKGVAVPSHIQHTGGDIAFLRLALKTRRMVCMTYAGFDPFYGQMPIAHMVDGAHLDDKLGAIIDNNEPGKWRWMSDVQLINRWLGKTDDGRNLRVGGGWLVAWLTSPPPPVDTTAKNYLPERPIVTPSGKWDDDEPESDKVYPDPDPFMGGEAPRPRPLYPNGYDPDMLKPMMRYWIDGEEVSRPQAFDRLNRAVNDLVDDSARPHLSIVSDDPKTAKMVAEATKPWADKLHVHVFPTGSWVTKQRLTAKVTAQLCADQNGKTVFKSDTVDAPTVVQATKAALGIVDPPPPPPPAPTPPPIVPAPVPAPDVPAPSAPVRVPMWAILAALAAWALSRKGKQ